MSMPPPGMPVPAGCFSGRLRVCRPAGYHNNADYWQEQRYSF